MLCWSSWQRGTFCKFLATFEKSQCSQIGHTCDRCMYDVWHVHTLCNLTTRYILKITSYQLTKLKKHAIVTVCRPNVAPKSPRDGKTPSQFQAFLASHCDRQSACPQAQIGSGKAKSKKEPSHNKLSSAQLQHSACLLLTWSCIGQMITKIHQKPSPLHSKWSPQPSLMTPKDSGDLWWPLMT